MDVLELIPKVLGVWTATYELNVARSGGGAEASRGWGCC
jgi:hypothetical protein